jgi:hypothetical protein
MRRFGTVTRILSVEEHVNNDVFASFSQHMSFSSELSGILDIAQLSKNQYSCNLLDLFLFS